MNEYKRCLAVIREYLNNKNLKLNEKKLDKIISDELEKPISEMDTHLIDLCLNALVAYRRYKTTRDEKYSRQPGKPL